MDEKTAQCDICFQIKCRKCEWVADDEEVVKIQQSTLTACPRCGWQPGT